MASSDWGWANRPSSSFLLPQRPPPPPPPARAGPEASASGAILPPARATGGWPFGCNPFILGLTSESPGRLGRRRVSSSADVLHGPVEASLLLGRAVPALADGIPSGCYWITSPMRNVCEQPGGRRPNVSEPVACREEPPVLPAPLPGHGGTLCDQSFASRPPILPTVQDWGSPPCHAVFGDTPVARFTARGCGATMAREFMGARPCVPPRSQGRRN